MPLGIRKNKHFYTGLKDRCPCSRVCFQSALRSKAKPKWQKQLRERPTKYYIMVIARPRVTSRRPYSYLCKASRMRTRHQPPHPLPASLDYRVILIQLIGHCPELAECHMSMIAIA